MWQPKVLLVEDDQAVRESLVWLFQQEGMDVEAYPNPADLLAAYDATQPGCLVLDLRLPEMTGIELLKKLRERGGTHPFIIITGHGEVPDATSAMRSGAVDFIEKPLDRKLLLERIREAIAKDQRQRSERLQDEHFRARLQSLTPREREVLDLVIEGLLTKQIASRLGIAIKTVEVHRSHIAKKMGVDSTIQLVRLCAEQSSRH